MPSQEDLFDNVPAFDRQSLAAKIHALAARKIFIGTSSWRYEDGCGRCIHPNAISHAANSQRGNYTRRAYISTQRRFLSSAVDFSFYSIPEPPFWRKVLSSAPRHLKWNLKTHEDFTVKRFPKRPRFSPAGGMKIRNFLDAEAFQHSFLEPLVPYLIE